MSKTSTHWGNASPEQSRSVFERTLDALPDGVLLVGHDRNIEYANQAFRALWRIPEAIFQSGDDARLLGFVLDQLNDPVQFEREVQRLYGTAEASQDELLFKDGRIFSRRSVPLYEGVAGSARIWIFTDITEARNAGIDSLTGLCNRRAYSQRFPGWISAPDDKLARAVALMDIDNFKSYNDIYGHAAGDEVLRRIAALLRGKLSQADDLAFRVGGEEFLLAFSGSEKRTAIDFFRAVRDSIVGMQIAHPGNPPYGIVTASFGVAVCKGPQDPAAVFRHADAALYRAKRDGRNAVALALTAD